MQLEIDTPETPAFFQRVRWNNGVTILCQCVTSLLFATSELLVKLTVTNKRSVPYFSANACLIMLFQIAFR